MVPVTEEPPEAHAGRWLGHGDVPQGGGLRSMECKLILAVVWVAIAHQVTRLWFVALAAFAVIDLDILLVRRWSQ